MRGTTANHESCTMQRNRRPGMLHWCKTGLHWCKRLLGDHFSRWPKQLLHPLPNHSGQFRGFGPLCSKHSGSQPPARKIYHSPRNFYKLIPLPDFFLYFFFCNFYGNSLRCGYCTKTKQEWPDSGSTLENIFVIFTKFIPRRIFFCIANVLVSMVLIFLLENAIFNDFALHYFVAAPESLKQTQPRNCRASCAIQILGHLTQTKAKSGNQNLSLPLLLLFFLAKHRGNKE